MRGIAPGDLIKRCGVLTPAGILATGWDGLVNILDAGGYDCKTATRLLEVCAALMRDYGCSRRGRPMISRQPIFPSSKRRWCARGCACVASPHASVPPADAGR